MSEKEKTLGIYYEHPEWFQKLFAALDHHRLDYVKLDAANHFYDAGSDRKDYDVLFNRMSASAYLRGHGNAMFYTEYFLSHLERKGVRVINGAKSYAIETSKARQLTLLGALGIKYPKTRIINRAAQAQTAARDLIFPIVVKPNIGGRGAGIVKFDSPAELESAIAGDLLDLGIDSTALVQEFAEKRGAHINRVETLGGKFLYAIKIYPTEESFNLCPAEVCIVENQPAALGEMCIADAPKTGLKMEKFEPPADIIETVERIVAEAQIDVGGVEYLIEDATGDALFYDINALSNFVADAINLIGFDPHENLIEFLKNELNSGE